MTKDQLLTLLTELGQSSLDGLAWLMGETERRARGLFLVAHDSLRSALNEKGKFDPKCFYDLVVTSEGDIRSLEEVKKAAARPGVSCVLISVAPLSPLSDKELDGIRRWDSLSAAQKDSLFTGPLAQLLRLQPKAKGKKAPVGSPRCKRSRYGCHRSPASTARRLGHGHRGRTRAASRQPRRSDSASRPQGRGERHRRHRRRDRLRL